MCQRPCYIFLELSHSVLTVVPGNEYYIPPYSTDEESETQTGSELLRVRLLKIGRQ